MRIHVLAAADYVVSGIIFVFAMYQFWLYYKRPERRECLLAGLLSFGILIYSVGRGMLYDYDRHEYSYFILRFAYLGLAIISHVFIPWASELIGIKLKRSCKLIKISFVISVSVLFFTDLVVPQSYSTIELSLVGRSLRLPVKGSLTSLYLAYCLISPIFSFIWLFIRRRDIEGSMGMYFIIGSSGWLSASFLNALISLRIWTNAPMYFLEYGFLFFAAFLFMRSINEHVRLLNEQESFRKLSERNFNSLLEASPLLICVIHKSQCIYANQALADLLGYKNTYELELMPIDDIFSLEDIDTYLQHEEKMLAKGHTRTIDRIHLQKQDGKTFSAKIKITPVNFNDKDATLIIGYDRTEEDTLKVHMMQMDRMVAIGTLAAGVGHEINNPLTFVAGNISTIVDDLRKIDKSLKNSLILTPIQNVIEEAIEALGEAQLGATRIRDIVTDLSNLSREPLDIKKVVDPNQMIESAVKLASNEIRHRATLIQDIKPIKCLRGNKVKLSQVILNLLVNAAHAIPKEKKDAKIYLRAFMIDEQIRIEIQDTGSGIDPAIANTIFEPFVTTKAMGVGTGLGLAISRQIIDDHQGTIEFETEVGKGTTFYINLPSIDDAYQTSTKFKAITKKTNLNIMLIDDEEMILRSLKRQLREHRITTHVDAHDAIDELRHSDENYDLILCDLMMPQLSGPDFYRKLQTFSPKLTKRVVFITGGVFSNDVRQFVDSLIHPPLIKPIDSKALDEVILNLE